MSVSWCDKLASRPTIGLRITPSFRPADNLLSALSPLFTAQIKPLAQGEKATFTIDKKEAFDVIFTLQEGYRYSLGPTTLAIAHVHKIELRNASAGLPWLNFSSDEIVFTKSLEEISSRLLKCAELLDEGSRRVTQFGLVSQTLVSYEEMPPGIVDQIENTVRPWGNAPFFSFQIVSILDDNDQHIDRCIQTISRSEDEEVIPTISLDWQRTLKDSRLTLRYSSVKSFLDECTEKALRYFEELGEGVS
jgi:hypothetical protein